MMCFQSCRFGLQLFSDKTHKSSLIIWRDLMTVSCELTWVHSWSRSLKILFVSLSVWLWLTIWKSTGASRNHIMYCFKLRLFQCGGPAHRNVWAYQREHLNLNTEILCTSQRLLMHQPQDRCLESDECLRCKSKMLLALTDGLLYLHFGDQLC